ncbi:MAG: FMN-binding protein [Candidatus Stygibacter frigidus]|nr:FMN-binding protein [Candidatus Stygibacter frigidus]
MKEKTNFLESRLYPVVFMIILSAILTLILAFSYQLSKGRVEMYQELRLQTNLLSLFKSEIPELNDKVIKENNPVIMNELYNKYLVSKILANRPDYQYYEFLDNGNTAGYVFPISAKGLWSTIKLLVAIDPEFNQYLGIKIISQGETPGLGARITENWFQEQFTGKVFYQGNSFNKLQLIEENGNPNADQILQITGATVSSKAIVAGIQHDLEILYNQNFSNVKVD